MHKKCSFFYEWWYLFTNWWSGDGLSIGTCFSWDFYGGTWKIFSSKTQQLHQILEAICWWHVTFANIEAIDHILTVLNSFDPNIQFTYEIEENSKLPFLDVMLCRKDNKLVCSVYRKSTNNDIYMNWHSFAPKT